MQTTAWMQERTRERGEDLCPATVRSMESMAQAVEASQRLWLDLWQMSAELARDNFRAMTRLQASALELASLPLTGWGDAQKELGEWYQRSLRTGVESLQRVCGNLAENGGTRGRREADGGDARGARVRDVLRGQWPQLRGRLRQQWGKLTDEDLEQVQGNADVLAARLRDLYSWSADQARQELERWLEQQRLPKAS